MAPDGSAVAMLEDQRMRDRGVQHVRLAPEIRAHGGHRIFGILLSAMCRGGPHLAFPWFHPHNRIADSGVPDTNTPVSSPGYLVVVDVRDHTYVVGGAQQ